MHTNIKILQLGKFYPIRGGVEKVMWDLTCSLSARGVHCDMLCAGFEPQVISFGSGRCIVVKALTKKAATMISPAMVLYLRRHAGEYDLIHVHHPDPMACLALCLSGYKGRVFVHWHSDIIKQKGLLKFYLPLQKWLLKRAERIIGTTPTYVRESPFLQNFQDKVCHLPIGIEDNIRVIPPATQPRAVQIFSLGRLVEYKGYKYLVEAARFLPENYVIEIGGEGPLKEELQAQIDAAGVNVKLLGRISDEQMREKMNSCDVFVLPSIMKTEAFGIVQIEAMSCSKPVVATTIPGSGTAWVNEHGVSGLNVPPADPQALADAIRAVYADRETFGAAARKRFEENFTLEKMTGNYLAML